MTAATENAAAEVTDFTGRPFPCPICGCEGELKKDKRGKPYLTCQSCHSQVFARGRKAILHLREKIHRRPATRAARQRGGNVLSRRVGSARRS